MYKIWFVVLAEICQKIREPLNFEDGLGKSWMSLNYDPQDSWLFIWLSFE